MADSAQPRAANLRLGAALTRRAVVEAANRAYLAGEPIDMSALATDLGIGRSTLYRLVGNREDLLSTVLAEATERTFRRAAAGTTAAGGTELVLDVLDRFMRAVVEAEPLQALCRREPLVFIRLALQPGPIEQTSASLVAEIIDTESAAGRMRPPVPPEVLGQAIIRMCDAHLYAPLLGRTEPEIRTALDLVAALLGHRPEP
ncbi:QsdR family transcriptional regulator [Saccharopolyspora griseoalba]|uniref:QsdR family transcriptional regulator n=1 Tax=Saccharopolyspora griseoalba TaxID=1431848 RepID=A0ABW2LNX5_9PSEU